MKTEDINNIEEGINLIIKSSGADTNKISDGYHTFGELYEHRIKLYMTICRLVPNKVWKSKLHSDGSFWEGWFILGINVQHGKQISYHLPAKYWDYCPFAEELVRAPEFDGHTSEDVLNRIDQL